MENNGIILFDGVCNLCNGSVNFIIDRDKNHYFKFSAQQSAAGNRFLNEYQLPDSILQTIVLIEDEKYYTRSTAALRIARKLDGAWPLMYGFIIIPQFIRNAIYNVIANNRYKWFGKSETCRIPTPELKSLFLEDV